MATWLPEDCDYVPDDKPWGREKPVGPPREVRSDWQTPAARAVVVRRRRLEELREDKTLDQWLREVWS